MKILLTGCTPVDTNGPRETWDRKGTGGPFSIPNAWHDALVMAGHEVVWRRGVLGENLDEFDLAVIGLAPILTTNVRQRALGALWAAATGIPVVFHVHDWQHPQNSNQWRTLVRKGVPYLHRTIGQGDAATPFHTEAPELIDMYGATILGLCEALLDTWPARWRLAFPAFEWGDKTLLERRWSQVPVERCGYVDWSGMLATPEEAFVPAAEKEMRWSLGALTPQLDWLAKLNCQWPVDAFGCRSRGQEKVPGEAAFAIELGKHWGSLNFRHATHCGSGWWRPRTVHAARVGTIIYADPREHAALRPEGARGLSVQDVEGWGSKYGADGLNSLAEAQGEVILSRAWTAAQASVKVNELVQAAHGRRES